LVKQPNQFVTCIFMVSEPKIANAQTMANSNPSSANFASFSQQNTPPASNSTNSAPSSQQNTPPASNPISNPNNSATSSNPPTDITSPLSTMPTFSQLFKLEGPNYLAWVAQFQPILRGNDLQGLVDGTDLCSPQFVVNSENVQVLNPTYVTWQKKDQLLLSWIICSLSPSIVSTMYGLKTSYEAWTTLATRYASQSKSRISHLKQQLQSLQQGSPSCTEYLNQAKQWADQLSAARKPIDDDDLISFVVSGLNPMFHTFVTIHSFATRDHDMTFADFQSELLNHEIILENQQRPTITPKTGSFALHAKQNQNIHHTPEPFQFKRTRCPPSRPTFRPQQFAPKSNFRGNGNQPAYNQNFRPPHFRPNLFHQQGTPQNRNIQTPTPPAPRPPCQICGKSSHNALDCYHRMDFAYQGRHPPTQLATMVAQLNEGFETQDWLANSGANTHITADSSNIDNPQPFDGADTVGVGNGAGLSIKHSGSSLVHSKTSSVPSFLLKNILHCPSASTNLLSINNYKFCIDNDCWFALNGSSFSVQDNLTGAMLLQGPSENGLYLIPLHSLNSLNKWKGLTAHLGVKTMDMVWHQRLGHPSFSIFRQLLKNHCLPLTGSPDRTRVCESCQLGKSKQFPFFDSTRTSTRPLELVHSNVWTSSVASLSGYKFYVLFVDDYSRFTWLYPILI